MKKTFRWYWKEWIKPLLVCAILVFSLRSAVADWNDVPTGSMKPTILEGDRVFVNRLAYDLKVPFTTFHITEWGDPKRGDIVVFFSPADGKRLVKRVVGLPGDTITMKDNRLIVNGAAVSYEPLDPAVSNQIEAAERTASQFASENLEGHPHAVMATPVLQALRSFGPVTVPAGKYFMMGDNRDNSFDSRFFGAVPRSKIVGRATAVVFSLDRNNYYLPRPGRVCDGLK
jgi:signal peptidase I